MNKFKVILLFSAAIGICSCKSNENTFSRDTLISTSMDALVSFYDYSAVNWQFIDTLYYRPYNADWPEDIANQILPDFPADLAMQYWHQIQNAKTFFHQATLALIPITDSITHAHFAQTEAALDSVFVNVVSQDFYNRLFVDCYQEIMPNQIDSLFFNMHFLEYSNYHYHK